MGIIALFTGGHTYRQAHTHTQYPEHTNTLLANLQCCLCNYWMVNSYVFERCNSVSQQLGIDKALCHLIFTKDNKYTYNGYIPWLFFCWKVHWNSKDKCIFPCTCTLKKWFVLKVRTAATAATAPASDLVEVFVDGTPVMVEPGTTVLQVKHVADQYID